MCPEFTGRTELEKTYLNEAKRRMTEAQKAYKLSIKKVQKGEQVAVEIGLERGHSIFAIILSVFALESYINRVGHDTLKKVDWERFRRNRLEIKWIVLPLILEGKTFDINSKLFKNFQMIIGLRNRLVHYDSYKFKKLVNHPSGGGQTSPIYKITNVKNAELAYNTANDMIKKLDDILKK